MVHLGALGPTRRVPPPRSRAFVTKYAPTKAREVAYEWTVDDADIPLLPAYVMHVQREPTAALFYDDKHMAVKLLYDQRIMSREGYMAAFRRLLDRVPFNYDLLPFSDWFSLVGSTEIEHMEKNIDHDNIIEDGEEEVSRAGSEIPEEDRVSRAGWEIPETQQRDGGGESSAQVQVPRHL